MANSIDAEYYAQLQSDKSSPLINYATMYKSAPGSTFKMVSATAGLMEGYITTNSTFKVLDLSQKPRFLKCIRSYREFLQLFLLPARL